MKHFIRKYEDKVTGSLSGFGRLVLRGTLRSLAVTCEMMGFLGRIGILLKHFGAFVEAKTAELKRASLETAGATGASDPLPAVECNASGAGGSQHRRSRWSCRRSGLRPHPRRAVCHLRNRNTSAK